MKNKKASTTTANRNRMTAILTLCLATGCAKVVMHTPTGQELAMTPEEFTGYVQQVYVHQNRVMSQLIRSTGDFVEDDFDEPAQLTAAARKMVRACAPFENIVAASLLTEVSGKGPDLKLADSVPACDFAARDVESVMP
jgi:hypothetical protein